MGWLHAADRTLSVPCVVTPCMANWCLGEHSSLQHTHHCCWGPMPMVGQQLLGVADICCAQMCFHLGPDSASSYTGQTSCLVLFWSIHHL